MLAIKDMEMPKNCEECDFRKSDPYSGEVYCSKAIGSNTIIYEKERLENCPLVEIVTCKDCKHYKYHGVNGYCSKRVNTDSRIDVYREPDYFCALGERREQDDCVY